MLARERRGLPAAVRGHQRRPSCAAGRRAAPVYDLDRADATAHDGHWAVLTGCRKGAVPAALAGQAAGRRGRAEQLAEMFGRENVVRRAGRPPPAGRRCRATMPLYDRGAAAQVAACVASRTTCTTRPRREAPLAQVLAAVRAPHPAGRHGGLAAGQRHRHLRSGAEMAPAWPGFPGCTGGRRSTLRRACAFDLRVGRRRTCRDRPVPEGHTEAGFGCGSWSPRGRASGTAARTPRQARRLRADRPRSSRSSRSSASRATS